MQPLPSTSEAELSLGAARTEEPSTSSQSRPRAPWPPIEHEVFLEALTLYGRDWRRVSKVLQDAAAGRGDVGAARSLAQVRSHAQKYFIKLEREGKANAVPPARPKRRPPPLRPSERLLLQMRRASSSLLALPLPPPPQSPRRAPRTT